MGWNILNPNDQNVLDALQSKFYVIVKYKSCMNGQIWTIVDVSKTMTLEETLKYVTGVSNDHEKVVVKHWHELPEDWKNIVNDWDGKS